MLYILLPLVAGILLSSLFTLPLWLNILFVLLSLGLFLLTKFRALIYLTLTLLGLFVASALTSGERVDSATDATLVVDFDASPHATLVAQQLPGGEWRSLERRVVAYVPDSLSHRRAICRADVATIEPSATGALAARRRQGYAATLRNVRTVEILTEPSPPLPERLNLWARERLSRLDLRSETYASAAAMGLAHRAQLDEQIVENYNMSGTAHLLALSGLHVGIVLLVISSLTYLFPLMPYGHIMSDVVAIIAVWLFAMVAGMGDSVMRAAWMFSLLQLSSTLSRRYNSLNALYTAAVMILLCDPRSIYDVGFQLSFVAVAAIITMAAPIVRALRTRWAVVNIVVSAFVVGSVATLATAPLISHYFGYIVVLSPLTTLPLLPTLTIIVLATIVWIICPLPLFAPLFAYILEVAVTLQNSFVEWFAGWNFGFFLLRINAIWVVVAYLILLPLAIFAARHVGKHDSRRSITERFDQIDRRR